MNIEIDQKYGSLETVSKPMLTTAEAAHYFNRQPQTLRGWACKEDGPLRPVRVHGRLGWLVSDIREVLGVNASPKALLGDSVYKGKQLDNDRNRDAKVNYREDRRHSESDLLSQHKLQGYLELKGNPNE